jgi:predicted transcriptional regulator of viral defense system
MSVSKTPRNRDAGKRLLKLARTRLVLRTRDVVDLGIHTGTLTRLARTGALERIGPGRYQLVANRRITEHHDLVMVASAVPASVACLMSALRFHGIGTQLPHQVWIAVPRGCRVPRLQSPPIRVVNVLPALFDIGVETHHIEGVDVRVYSVARTVADCFRFRNMVGLDVALEAVSEAWRGKRLNLDELDRIGRRLRIQRVMQPYLEMVVL